MTKWVDDGIIYIYELNVISICWLTYFWNWHCFSTLTKFIQGDWFLPWSPWILLSWLSRGPLHLWVSHGNQCLTYKCTLHSDMWRWYWNLTSHHDHPAMGTWAGSIFIRGLVIYFWTMKLDWVDFRGLIFVPPARQMELGSPIQPAR